MRYDIIVKNKKYLVKDYQYKGKFSWRIIGAARAEISSHRGLDPRSAAEKYG